MDNNHAIHAAPAAGSRGSEACAPRYDRLQTYAWNYEHAPEAVACDVPEVAGTWELCGLQVDSPLGIAAGPLLNGQWILYYASLGFDVLTYKTVRSRNWPCYDLPNLQPVAAGRLTGGEADLRAIDQMAGNWAISYGMPSKPPEVWRDDVAATHRKLPPGKLLSVSVVAAPEDDWSLERVADDYAQCAAWAVESGADLVEANFSCPNVASCDGQLFQNPASAGFVAARIRAAIGTRAPLLIKMGHITDNRLTHELSAALAASCDALVMTNAIAATVVDADGQQMFGGQKRGIGGRAIRDASVANVARFREVIEREGLPLRLVGVGGISTAADVKAYLDAGAHSVQLATSAMIDPGVGLSIRRKSSLFARQAMDSTALADRRPS